MIQQKCVLQESSVQIITAEEEEIYLAVAIEQVCTGNFFNDIMKSVYIYKYKKDLAWVVTWLNFYQTNSRICC